MEKNYIYNLSTLLCALFSILFLNTAFSQVEIARQRFNNGSNAYQSLVADKDGPNPASYIPPPSQMWSSMGMNGYVPDAKDWDFLATTNNGQIRIVNTNVAPFVSPSYSLEFLNYWNDRPTLEFETIDISNFNNVTFSVDYRSTGSPDNNEDLFLDYSYSLDNGLNWTNRTIKLIDGVNGNRDALDYGVSGAEINPYVLGTGVIPNAANAFKATIRANFRTGANGNDNYYIDDVVLSGTPTTIEPVAICNSDFSISLDAFGGASITANDIDNGSYIQNSGTMTLSIDKTDFTCADLGSNIITLTVSDGIQSETCTTTVTVNGYTGPIVAPTIPNTTTYCSYTASTPVDVSYQCSTITPTTTDPVTFNTPGNYSITWTYSDPVSGNSTNTVQNISLNNIVAPTGLNVTSIGADTATLSWNNQIGISSYEIRYKKNGLVNWQTVTSTINTVVLTDLDQLALYDFQVASTCGTLSTYGTISNFTTLGYAYCEPDLSNTSDRVYVRTVKVGTIDNTEAREPGGYDDNTHLSTVLYKNENHIFNLTFRNSNYYNIGHVIWIDFNGDGDFEDAGEQVWNNNGNLSNVGQFQTHSPSIFIPSFAVSGLTRMRVGVRQDGFPNNSCDNDTWVGGRGEFEDYTLDLQIRPDSPQEIDVTGRGNLIIDESGVAELSSENNTDFGVYDIYEIPLIKTYKITNNGADPLVLTGTPIVQFVSNTGDFKLTQPTISYLAIGESTTFTITFNPTTIGTKVAVIEILNDDFDAGDTEDEYTFLVQGEAVETFPDTDGDGVPDNIDGDDDNDGILDTSEDATCKSYAYASQVETVFLNETFGAGYDRITVDQANAGSRTTYCFEDGTASCGRSNDLQDGSYTIYYQSSNGTGGNQTPIEDVAYWADNLWYSGLDHTDNSIDGSEPGRMLLVNADYDPGVFYEATINGVTPGVEVVYGFSVINLFKVGGAIKPQVAIAVYDPNGVQIALESSGLIEETNPSNPDGDWVTVETTFTTTSSQFTIQLINDQVGGYGNDLAIDDIYVKQVLCDLDSDGVADIIDLDNDDDGIPNIVELGIVDADHDATLFGSGWIDTNGNGVHDAYEGGATLIDTDGDGTPDYLDVDSDNDGIFDAVEYNGFGDIDIDGDGVGDGVDGFDTDSSLEQDGDGILGIADLNDDGIGTNHGSNNYPDPLDDDNDGVPNYLDIDSNDPTNDPNNGSDIDETIYAHLDINNDGVIDGNTDIDFDGILDSFDTDTNIYGSPRDLNDSYSLFFDGRNDYVEEGPVINGWADATIMSWIKIEATASGDRYIVGQNSFYLIVENSGTLSTVANGIALRSNIILPTEEWVHVAASYNSGAGELILYVNGGVAALNRSISGGFSTDLSSLTIGRKPNTNSNYFEGEIDEVRIFDAALTEDEIQKMIYQELDEAHNFNRGKIIPKDISSSFSTSLKRYYKMDGYKGDILDDKSTTRIDQGTGAKLYNIKDIYFQTAPLPYVTTQDGDWAAENTWLHGNVWDIEDELTNKSWSIVDVNHNVTTANSHKQLGLFIEDTKTLTINNDNEVNTSWYLELEGTLDLKDDSQLIQGKDSDLVTSVNGKILRRQEGTNSMFWYNYWSSPVGSIAATSYIDNNAHVNNVNNSDFTLNMLKDGAGNRIEFTNSLNEIGKVSTRWLYSFKNGVTYYDWNSLAITEAIAPGIGYTQKGIGQDLEQQYIFEGKPNNGTILIDASDTGGLGSIGGSTLTTSLLGNPYPSALDARQFIRDNVGTIDGTILLWQQWAGESHHTESYQGGYAYINGLTTVKAAQYPYSVATSLLRGGEKRPSFYIPISQGFFVEVVNNGTIEFNNGQRVFVKESDGSNTNPYSGSTFFKGTNTLETIKESESNYQLLRLKLEMSDTSSRTMALGFDASFTDEGREYGFDGGLIETPLVNDLGSLLGENQFIIQALAPITEDKVVNLTFTASGTEIYNIKNIEIANIPDEQAIYLRDNFLGVYFDLRDDKGYSFTSEAGTFNDRFDVVFNNGVTLTTEDFESVNDTVIYFDNKQEILFVKSLKETVKQLTLYNALGQKVMSKQNLKTVTLENGIVVSNLSTGLYIVSIKTDNNQTIDKKIIIE